MKAWYLDDKECRCTLAILRELGVQYWFIPLDQAAETSGEMLATVSSGLKCTGCDEIEVTAAALAGGSLPTELCAEAREHSHPHEVEARLVLDGEAILDVRDSADLWVCAPCLAPLPTPHKCSLRAQSQWMDARSSFPLFARTFSLSITYYP